MSAYCLRRATAADLAAIRDIYNHYVAHSTCTFQIEADTFEERAAWLSERSARHPAVVAESNDNVIGWAALSPWKSRCGYSQSVEISLYVRNDHRRLGIGRALTLDLIGQARADGLHTIIAGVCSEHAASLALFASLGFERAAYFYEVGFKFNRWLDVVYLQLMLAPADRPIQQ